MIICTYTYVLRIYRKDLPKTIEGLKFQMKGYFEEDSERINITLRENVADTFYLILLNELDKPLYVYEIFKICKLTDIIIPLTEKNLPLQILPSKLSNFLNKCVIFGPQDKLYLLK